MKSKISHSVSKTKYSDNFEALLDFVIFHFQDNPKDLDPSYKTDLDLFKKGKTCIIAKFRRTDLVISSHSREGKTPSYS